MRALLPAVLAALLLPVALPVLADEAAVTAVAESGRDDVPDTGGLAPFEPEWITRYIEIRIALGRWQLVNEDAR